MSKDITTKHHNQKQGLHISSNFFGLMVSIYPLEKLISNRFGMDNTCQDILISNRLGMGITCQDIDRKL